jgi:hypothetical protein
MGSLSSPPGTGKPVSLLSPQQAAVAQAQHANWMAKQRSEEAKQFMIEGKRMDLVEFVETLYPEDCPERTYLLLKLKEK